LCTPAGPGRELYCTFCLEFYSGISGRDKYNEINFSLAFQSFVKVNTIFNMVHKTNNYN
jgi:hypothetical protein